MLPADSQPGLHTASLDAAQHPCQWNPYGQQSRRGENFAEGGSGHRAAHLPKEFMGDSDRELEMEPALSRTPAAASTQTRAASALCSACTSPQRPVHNFAEGIPGTGRCKEGLRSR